MLRIALSAIALSLLVALTCAYPITAHGQPVCVNDASGQALCAEPASCRDLTACTQNSDCAAGSFCGVNTCCPSSVCIPIATGFVCEATGPFNCGGDFPNCVVAPVSASVPTLSAPMLAVCVLLLTGLGMRGLLRSKRAKLR